MKETVDLAADWFFGGWDGPPADDDPRDRLNEYIIGPAPLPDQMYDEGGCD